MSSRNDLYWKGYRQGLEHRQQLFIKLCREMDDAYREIMENSETKSVSKFAYYSGLRVAYMGLAAQLERDQKANETCEACELIDCECYEANE
jgi:hypothetical protein